MDSIYNWNEYTWEEALELLKSGKKMTHSAMNHWGYIFWDNGVKWMASDGRIRKCCQKLQDKLFSTYTWEIFQDTCIMVSGLKFVMIRQMVGEKNSMNFYQYKLNDIESLGLTVWDNDDYIFYYKVNDICKKTNIRRSDDKEKGLVQIIKYVKKLWKEELKDLDVRKKTVQDKIDLLEVML